jgi:hypothetical protein
MSKPRTDHASTGPHLQQEIMRLCLSERQHGKHNRLAVLLGQADALIISLSLHIKQG